MRFREKLLLGSMLLLLFSTNAIEGQLAKRSIPAIPSGSQLQVRMIDSLTSETAKPGDTFRATLEQPIRSNSTIIFPKGSDVTGRVTAAHRSGRLSDPGTLELTLVSVGNGRNSAPLNVTPLRLEGQSHAKSNVGKIGGGAAAGAIIGAIAGGGKGAAIGAGAGAAAGTGAAAATGRKEAIVESEAVLTWVTAQSLYAQSSRANNADKRNTADRHQRLDGDEGRNYNDPRNQVFTERERGIIRACFADNYSNLPPGLAKKDRLPPGLEKQLRRNGTLPPGLQKRVQPLPGACEARLPRLPVNWRRVVYGGRVLLLNEAARILDMFLLGDQN